MCGIVGIVESDLNRPVAPEDLARMVRTLHHRGPDEEGSVTLSGVGLGMRRLSIVDLAGGQQPFSNETDSIQLVANGEIYNFAAASPGARRRWAISSAADPTSKCSCMPTKNGASRS